MTIPPPLQIAVVGAGPSGCYLAQALQRAVPGCEITIFDRLVSPFGLVRYGVAADHQHTKAITRQFDRLFQSGVRFAGDLEIGRDIGLAELREHFDVVALATGLPADRALEIPGAELPGVVGAGTLTRALNSHPDQPRLPAIGQDVLIIGGGNVAVDVLRFLVKDRAGFAASDVSDAALDDYLTAPARRITLVSRSGVAASKADPQMLKELANLPRATYASPDPARLPSDSEPDRTAAARVAAIAELTSAARPAHPGPEVTLRFGLTPVRILGTQRAEGVEFRAGDRTITIAADTVITAVGFAADETDALRPFVERGAETGRIEPGLYRTGWAKRGPRGAIPENRACAKAVADEIAADLAADPASLGRAGFAGLPEEVRTRAIGYAQWLALDEHERRQAPADRVRRKLGDHAAMAAIARADAPDESNKREEHSL